ncbi:uncharacterized protein LOC106173431 [Lingula anatina]|uniref:Uncharacterized protein LOC106173431 n=1 Tax=Lingula anatina TaxID=7574 RepID=A0A1S3JHY2_LINAN|nr:uncharacterized protein LOC106173431 [Lingula anatina]|eukprot:XP_013410025.1 uncharacterized protein LOC106173431 [Lingula anatina]
MQETRRTVLAFGGNGCLGAAAVRCILGKAVDGGALPDITIVNRGNWYWDTATSVKPHVRHIEWDRTRPLEDCPRFMEYLSQVKSLDAVIDFSACRPRQIENAVSLLKGKAKLYIYISSDSVYEVSAVKEHDGPSRETDAVRPEAEDEAKRLAEADDYGNRKLQCEEELVKQRSSTDGPGIPYIFLRLPDVIGLGENTYRWWVYQLWIRLGEYISRPVTVPDFLHTRQISLVYSEDVGKVVADIINMKIPRDQIIDQAFNLASDVNMTLPTLLRDISLELGLGDKPYEIVAEKSPEGALPGVERILNKYMTNLGYGELATLDETPSSTYVFPSVHRGPVDISKAKKLLAFRPTPWREALADIVTFYENAMRDDSFATRQDFIETMLREVAKNDKEAFYRGLAEIYGFKAPQDE